MRRCQRARRSWTGHFSDPSGFTLIEILIAVAITLLMMLSAVTLFANLSDSVRNRRATIEMSNQLLQVRNVLQEDLKGATCPGLTWQRPESNHGYIELIEGPYRDTFPSMLTDGNDDSDENPDVDGDTVLDPDELDPALTLVPRANDGSLVQRDSSGMVVSTLNGLGDYDDILMLTVRNEHEPFVGRVPSAKSVRLDEIAEDPDDEDDFISAETIDKWDSELIESPLAEVVWFAVENPSEAENRFVGQYFGEPGMRTIYRRALLIAPWINPYRYVDEDGVVHDTFSVDGAVFTAQPGLVRILPGDVERGDVATALAALIAFQERFDLSVRLEFDPLLDPDADPTIGGRWKIVANTLADLTKRENRYEHHFYSTPGGRRYPFAVVSRGSGYSDNPDVVFVPDPELGGPMDDAEATGNLVDDSGNLILPQVVIVPGVEGTVASYSTPGMVMTDNIDDMRRYPSRPYAYAPAMAPDPLMDHRTPATARPILNDQGQVIRVIHGLVPLWGPRRGEDVMMTDVLAFDLRVYDPGAPLYQEATTGTLLEPSDAGWPTAFTSGVAPIGQGAYVDMGYVPATALPISPAGASWINPWFAEARALSDVYLDDRPPGTKLYSQFAPGYAVYDTWSFHYENNGLNEDQWRFDETDDTWKPVDTDIDGATNGLDDVDFRTSPPVNELDAGDVPIGGIDDVRERETKPPYDKPLRGIQVILRVYERDARQIKQVRVNQHFMPE